MLCFIDIIYRHLQQSLPYKSKLKWLYIFMLVIVLIIISIILLHSYMKINKRNGFIEDNYGNDFNSIKI